MNLFRQGVYRRAHSFVVEGAWTPSDSEPGRTLQNETGVPRRCYQRLSQLSVRVEKPEDFAVLTVELELQGDHVVLRVPLWTLPRHAHNPRVVTVALAQPLCLLLRDPRLIVRMFHADRDTLARNVEVCLDFEESGWPFEESKEKPPHV